MNGVPKADLRRGGAALPGRVGRPRDVLVGAEELDAGLRCGRLEWVMRPGIGLEEGKGKASVYNGSPAS